MTTQHQNHQTNTKRDSDGQFASKSGSSDKGSNNSSGSGGKSASGNGGNFANDREKASEAGRKGGENSHGGKSSSRSNKDDE